MNDLISRQAAIDAMNTRLEDIKLTWRGKVKKGEIAMYLDMRGVIETLPSAQPEPKWIPVSERLPEENGRYLVRYKRDIVLDYIEVHDDEARIMRFFVGDGWRYPFLCQPELRKAEQQTVTHWMALPGLPVEENTNGK